MASVVASPQCLDYSCSHLSMQPEDNSYRLEEAGRTLIHQQSLGNPQLQSIDENWLAEHKDLLDIFIQNPNDPQVLDKIPEVPEAPPSDPVQMPPLQMPPLHMHQQSGLSLSFQPQEAASSSSQHMSLPESFLNPFSVPRPKEDTYQLDIHPLASMFPASTLTSEIETPQRQASRSSGLRPPKSSPRIATRSDSAPTPGRSYDSHQRGSRKNVVPEISLAERADTLGATSLQQTARRQSNPRAASLAVSRSSEENSEEPEEAEEVAGESAGQQEGQQRKGPGRKKRTSPMLIETEDGDCKYVTPAEYRKLRRRITNRLSARRMRKKHADEKNMIHSTQVSLQTQVDQYKEDSERLRGRMTQLELDNGILQAENQRIKAQLLRYEQQPSAVQPQQVFGQFPILQTTPLLLPGLGQPSSPRREFPTVSAAEQPIFGSHFALPRPYSAPAVSSMMQSSSFAPPQLPNPTADLSDMPEIPFGRFQPHVSQSHAYGSEAEDHIMDTSENIFTSQHMMQ